MAIVLVCPVRVKNLAGIHLERNLHRPGDGRVFLVFENDEVKNERHAEFELPSDVSRMIDKHLATRAGVRILLRAISCQFPRGPMHSSGIEHKVPCCDRRECGF